MKEAAKKLRSSAGFTLTETFMALLILLMVAGILAGGIPVAQRAYVKVVDTANAQVLVSTTMTLLRDELGTASRLSVSENQISYINSSVSSKLANGADGIDGIAITQYGTAPRALVTPGTATNGLTVSYEGVSYADGVVTFTGLAVKKGTATLAGPYEYKVRVIAG